MVWIRDRAVMIWRDVVHPVSIQGVMFDVTDRKQVEEELQTLNDDLEQRVAERTEQ